MDNFEDLRKQTEAMVNFINMAEALYKMPEDGDLVGSLTHYEEWIGKLCKDPEKNKDVLMDQLLRVVPKLTIFINSCIDMNEALTDELEGNTNDIFNFDDSFFKFDDDADDK